MSAPCDYPLKKEVIESAPSVKSGSTTLSQRPVVQILSMESLKGMKELDKEMYRRQLNDEIQFLIRKDLKV